MIFVPIRCARVTKSCRKHKAFRQTNQVFEDLLHWDMEISLTHSLSVVIIKFHSSPSPMCFRGRQASNPNLHIKVCNNYGSKIYRQVEFKGSSLVFFFLNKQLLKQLLRKAAEHRGMSFDFLPPTLQIQKIIQIPGVLNWPCILLCSPAN